MCKENLLCAKLPPVLHALMNTLRRRADNTGTSVSCNHLDRLVPAKTVTVGGESLTAATLDIGTGLRAFVESRNAGDRDMLQPPPAGQV